MIALDAMSGALQWQADVGPARKPLTAPVTDDERFYVGARDGLYALDLDGHAVWHFPTSRRITAAPVVTGGVVYATCHDHHLYALDAAGGKPLWRYAVERRIEVSPLVFTMDLANGTDLSPSVEAAFPLAVITDRSGTVTCLQRPLSAPEHENAGHWIEAAHLWQVVGQPERAAVQYEVAGVWSQAADLWAAQGNALRQAGALQRHARFLEETGTPLEGVADLWATIVELYETQGERALAASCRREVARCRRQPKIALEIEHDGLVLNAWTMVSFIVRNVGFGPAHNLIIRASGEQFDGQITRTQRLVSLDADERKVESLDIKPLEYGKSVPLTVTAEYTDYKDEVFTQSQTLHMPVSETEPVQRARTRTQVIRVTQTFVDLEIRIFRRQAEGYPVEITLGAGQAFPRGYADAAIADWTLSGDAATDGARLFCDLFADEKLRDAWSRACGQAPRRRIRLRIDPNARELRRLPWELLQVDGIWLAADAHTPLSRFLPVSVPLGAGVEARPRACWSRLLILLIC